MTYSSRGRLDQLRDNQEQGYLLVVFLIWPFLGALLSMFKLDKRISWFILGAFCLFFGLTFNPVNDQLDSFRYALEFNAFMTNPHGNFISALSEFKYGDIKDIYTVTCYYITSLVGGGIHTLYSIFAAVFAFFSLKSMKIIVSNPNYQSTIICIILISLVVYSNSIFNINGVRYWTAAWVAVFATFKVLIENRKVYFALLLVPPLIHGTFWLYLAVVLIAFFIKIGIKPLFIAYIISFFFTELVLNNMNDILISRLPVFMQNLVWAYTESDTALRRISGENIEDQPLYWKILTSLPRYYEMFLVCLLAIEFNNFSRHSQRLVIFLLTYLIIVNLFSAIPSMVRFYFLMVPMLAYIWISEKNQLHTKAGFIYAIPVVILYGAFQLLRYILSTNGIGIFMPLPILTIL